MKLNNTGYTANIYFNDTLLQVDPQDYSFSIIDNIDKFYCTAVFTFHDVTGFMQEFLNTTIGSRVSISFGDNETLNTTHYRVLYDYLDSPQTVGHLNGSVDMFLIHEYFFEQKVLSTAYTGRISKIVKDLVGKYDFSSVDVNDTGNENTWYQTNITDAKFIQERLLPFAYSNNASDTPFYSYITTDNVYHLRNGKAIMDSTPVSTIKNIKLSGQNDSGNDERNYTSEIKRWRTNYKNIFTEQVNKVYSLNIDDGTLIEEVDNLVDHPPQANLKTPLIIGNKNNVTSIQYTSNFIPGTETGDTENEKGYINNRHRSEQFIDNLLILQMMNPKYHAGVTVQFNTYNIDKTKTELAKNFSGKYIVMECEHIWDGESGNVYSKLLLGRKYINIPNSYLLKDGLL